MAEACRLLESADIATTTIVYDVAFLAKSNFNREFRRVTGMNPTEWRAKRTPGPAQAVVVEKMVSDRRPTL
nr:AraC family transcriptional regulator [Sinorhizobium sp. A49]